MNLFSLIIIAGGAYITYAAIMLKAKGEINRNVMLPRNREPKNCKDPEGFNQYMFGRTLAFGILAFLAGMWTNICTYVTASWIPSLIVGAAFVGYAAYYMKCIKEAEKKFW